MNFVAKSSSDARAHLFPVDTLTSPNWIDPNIQISHQIVTTFIHVLVDIYEKLFIQFLLYVDLHLREDMR